MKWLGRGFQVKFGCGIFAVLLVEFDLTFEMIRDIVPLLKKKIFLYPRDDRAVSADNLFTGLLEFINKLRAIGAYPQLLWVALWLR